MRAQETKAQKKAREKPMWKTIREIIKEEWRSIIAAIEAAGA